MPTPNFHSHEPEAPSPFLTTTYPALVTDMEYGVEVRVFLTEQERDAEADRFVTTALAEMGWSPTEVAELSSDERRETLSEKAVYFHLVAAERHARAALARLGRESHE